MRSRFELAASDMRTSGVPCSRAGARIDTTRWG